MESIELFYLKLTELWKVCPVPFQAKMAVLFRKIIHAGKNPDELSNQNDEDSPKGTTPSNPYSLRNRVVDKEYIMERLKASGALVGIVYQFNLAAQLLDYKLGNVVDEDDDNLPPPPVAPEARNSLDEVDMKSPQQNSRPNITLPTLNGRVMTYEEELAWYGVIRSPKPNPVTDSVENSTEDFQPEGERSPLPHSPQQQPFPDFNEEEPTIIINKSVLRELTQLMLNLCLDITNHNFDAACMMFEYGLADGAVQLISKDFQYDCRDKRISYDIELLWNVLESFMDVIKLEYENDQAISTNHKSTPGHNQITENGSMYADMNESTDYNGNSTGKGGSKDVNIIYHSYILNHEPPHASEQNLNILTTSSSLIDLEKAVKTLYSILLFLINDGFRQSDKELRNEIIIILSLLAEFPYSVGHFIHTELLHLLITYSCVEEMSGKNSLGNGMKWPFFLKNIANVRNFATISDSDLEFKKLIWNLLTVLCKFNDVDLLLCISASPLLSCLLQYLEFIPSISNGTAGTANPASTLQASALLSKAIQMQPSASLTIGNAPAPNASILENSEVLVSKSLQFPTGKLAGLQSMSKSIIAGDAAGGGSLMAATGLAGRTLATMTAAGGMSGAGSSSKKSLISQLTPSKLKEFQIQSALFFVLNGNKFLCEIERLAGIPRIISLLLTFSQSDQAEHKTVVFYLIMFLYKAIRNSISIRHYLEENSGVAILLHLFSTCYQSLTSNSNAASSGSNGVLEQSCAQILRTLSLLCEPSNLVCQEQYYQLNGSKTLLQPIKTYVTKRPAIVGLKAGIKIVNDADLNDPYVDPLDNPFGGEISIVIIAIINAFSKAVIGNSANELSFVDLEGMDILLDLLETSPFILRIHVLRLFSDILQNAIVIPYVYSWRSGKTLRSASQLICHAWLDEEARLNAERKDSNGIICDLLNPLGNQQWPLADFEIPLLGGSQTLSVTLANTASPLLTGGFNNSSSVFGGNSAFGGEGGLGGVSGREASGSFTVGGQSSVIISKLATAILAGRNAIQTNLPIDISLKVLQSDTRVILSNILQALKLFEIYQIENEANPYKPNLLAPNDTGGTTSATDLAEIIHDQPLNSSLPNTNVQTPSIYNSVVQQNNEHFSHQLSPQYNHHHAQHDQSPGRGEFQSIQPSPSSPNLSYHSTTNVNLNNIIHGFDEIKLTPKEKQVLSIAKKYIMLRESDWWKDIYRALQIQGIIPIEADMTLIDMRLEYSYDASIALQVEQMKLYHENEFLKKQSENQFIDQILTKKNQQIKAEWLKKNAKGGFKKKNIQNKMNQSKQGDHQINNNNNATTSAIESLQ